MSFLIIIRCAELCLLSRITLRKFLTKPLLMFPKPSGSVVKTNLFSSPGAALLSPFELPRFGTPGAISDNRNTFFLVISFLSVPLFLSHRSSGLILINFD